ncbi:MAG: Unknown protein [uncultured Aureispira sp.]|uniref:Nucleotidyltransferase n=1 Tax=uncultured Aureispira sp. TaxID=1331704 RepID=A0A6S6UDQ3_9BACT|nr:MAG: Unknown protein [uncultured Aureispira sp.]
MKPLIKSDLSCDLKIASQILEPLFYYDIFSYPLTVHEIYEFSCYKRIDETPINQIEAVLAELVEKGYLYEIDQFYALTKAPKWGQARKENNQRALKYLKRAHKMTRLMTCFPYVRGVFVSGSLSKNVMPLDGDIDYFIVTKPQRLWVTRTFLVLFKKVFLFNSKKHFCVNYFVDEDLLEIEEKNRFTATEVATVLPIYGRQMYQDFWAANGWLNTYYPNVAPRNLEQMLPEKQGWIQFFMEKILNTKLGDWLDAFFMKRTLKRWDEKFEGMAAEDFKIALKSRRNVSKHHPRLFQQKVIKAFMERVEAFETKHQVELDIKESSL